MKMKTCQINLAQLNDTDLPGSKCESDLKMKSEKYIIIVVILTKPVDFTSH